MAVAFLLSLSVHECAHAWTAWRLGDETGYLLGRVSLNPVRHIDPVGTLLLPGLLLWSTKGAFVFGYAKPVPYQPYALRNPYLGSAAIAGAGPASNFLLATASAVALGLVSGTGPMTGTLGHRLLVDLIVVNACLGIFNLVPVPPLDGFTVVAGLLPRRLSMAWGRLEALGPALFVVLVVTGTLRQVTAPVTDFALEALGRLAVHVGDLRG
jgi:Zn-dependent protease